MREMKDSGLRYIGKIPKTWSIKALKYSCDMYGRIGFRGYTVEDLVSEGEGAITLSPSNFNGMSLDYSKCSFLSWDKYYESPEIMINNGDVLLVKTASVGKCVYVDNLPIEATVNPQILVLKNHKDCAKYVAYLLQTSIAKAYFDTEKGGSTIYTISQEKIARFLFPFPPLSEQQRIIDFLDRKCSDVDKVLEKTKASIEQYKRLKQSVITEAVTKGIRKGRLMKDSDSTWFGPIPATWDANKLKYTFTIRKRIVGEDGHTVLAITQKGVKPKDMSNGNGQFAESYANYQIVHPGDFAMNHMDLLTGWVDISQYEGVTSPDYRVFTLDDTTRNCPGYYLYMMQMCYTNRIFYSMGQGVSGMGRWRLPADMFNNFIIACPPLDEQQEIAEYLDKNCSEIDSLIASKEKFIAELESYKKSLIYEYVTGKKEVPET